MPDPVDEHRQTSWFLTGDSQQWVVTETGFIDVDEEVGIFDGAQNSDIRVFGWIRGPDDGLSIGISLGNTSTLAIGADAWIFDFEYGIDFAATGRVVNQGTIEAEITGASAKSGGTFVNLGGTVQGGEWGIGLGDGTRLENSGLIRGIEASGVAMNGDESSIDNQAGGRIIGRTFGIGVGDVLPALSPLADPLHVTITNAGTIRSLGDAAVYAAADTSMILKNTGTIIGDIVLGDIGNTIDTRGGQIRGSIIGGDGTDTYKISRSDIDIQDYGSAFGDTVISTASYELVGNLDNLLLRGKANINGKGNIGHNIIGGNDGKNRLEGLEGTDHLDGGKGTDILIGGGGVDEFQFTKGYGSDRINDLEVIDFIASDYVRTARDFKRLDIMQAGDDLIIDFGHGDKLRLVDFDRDDLSFDIFNPPA